MLPVLDELGRYLHAFAPNIRLTLMDKGGNGMMQVINLPNWLSTDHRISVQFNDFVQWDNVLPLC
jgi:hypothetical protein